MCPALKLKPSNLRTRVERDVVQTPNVYCTVLYCIVHKKQYHVVKTSMIQCCASVERSFESLPVEFCSEFCKIVGLRFFTKLQ